MRIKQENTTLLQSVALKQRTAYGALGLFNNSLQKGSPADEFCAKHLSITPALIPHFGKANEPGLKVRHLSEVARQIIEPDPKKGFKPDHNVAAIDLGTGTAKMDIAYTDGDYDSFREDTQMKALLERIKEGQKQNKQLMGQHLFNGQVQKISLDETRMTDIEMKFFKELKSIEQLPTELRLNDKTAPVFEYLKEINTQTPNQKLNGDETRILGTIGKIQDNLDKNMLNEAEIDRLKHVFTLFSKELKKHHVDQRDIVIKGTEWFRQADQQQLKAILNDQECNPLSLSIEEMSSTEEGNMAYRAGVRHLGLKDNTKTIYLVIGDGSTEWMFGTGPRLTDGYLNRYWDLGCGGLGFDSKNPFDLGQVQKAIRVFDYKKSSRIFEDSTISYRQLQKEAQDKRRLALIKPGNVFTTLRDLEIKHHQPDIYEVMPVDEQEKDKKKPAIFRQRGLSKDRVKSYLTQNGLTILKNERDRLIRLEKCYNQWTPGSFFQKDKKELQDKIKALQEMPAKLVILFRSMELLGIETIRFANTGGISIGMLVDNILAQKRERYDKEYADDLLAFFTEKAKSPSVKNLAVSLSEYGDIGFSAKTRDAIVEKLLYRFINSKIDYSRNGSPKTRLKPETVKPSDVITDGIRGRLVLNDTSPKGVEKVVNKLIELIQNKKIKVLGIDNYPAQWTLTPDKTFYNSLNDNGLPYLNKTTIENLVKTLKIHQPNQALKDSRDKKWGYTTLQFDLETEDGIPLELQIRGSLTNWMAEVDRILYDIRNDKELPLEFKKFEKHAILLQKKFGNDEMDRYFQYIRDYYTYVRQKELDNNYPSLNRPQLPENTIIDEHGVMGTKGGDVTAQFSVEHFMKMLKGIAGEKDYLELTPLEEEELYDRLSEIPVDTLFDQNGTDPLQENVSGRVFVERVTSDKIKMSFNINRMRTGGPSVGTALLNLNTKQWTVPDNQSEMWDSDKDPRVLFDMLYYDGLHLSRRVS